MVDFSPGGRIGTLVVRGAPITGQVAELVVSASIVLDYSSVTELDLTLMDHDLDVSASLILDKGSPVDYQDLKMLVASNELQDAAGGPQLVVVARSLGVRKLRNAKGAHTWRNQSPTQVVAAEARKAGMKVVGQPSAKRRQIRRGKKESSWGMDARLAKELGFVVFEAAGTLFFGKPTWLLANAAKTHTVTWSRADALGDGGLASFPNCRRAEDSKKNAASITVELNAEDADTWRPGDALVLAGVPTFNGRYLITKVTIPGNSVDNVVAEAMSPENPKPEPPPKKTKTVGGGTSSGGATSSNTVSKIVNAALGQAGTRYAYGAEASGSDPDPDAFDCSELVQWACARAGVKMVDGSSAQRAYCQAHGTLISVDRAVKIRGALLFKSGHVAISLGNGRTIEAANRKYGVGQLSAGGRGWTTGALIPGVKYPKG